MSSHHPSRWKLLQEAVPALVLSAAVFSVLAASSSLYPEKSEMADAETEAELKNPLQRLVMGMETE